MKRIGLLGGSFNPAHRGHRRLSLHALRALDLDEVWWMVSPGNPLKDKAGMAPFKARMASARVMARHAPIRVSAIETRLKTRYTADTLTKLPRLYPNHRFIWLMGADNLAQFHRWERWRHIARQVPIAVVARPGYDRNAHASPAMAGCGALCGPQVRLNIGRDGDCRHLCCCASAPIRLRLRAFGLPILPGTGDSSVLFVIRRRRVRRRLHSSAQISR